jgi:beta-lactamase class D
MNRRHFIEALGVAVVVGAGITTSSAQDLSPLFRNTNGAFVLYDLNKDRYIRHNEARCRRRFSPYSTFKIPNSLIGLETGVLRDADFRIAWDKRKYPPGTLGTFD